MSEIEYICPRKAKNHIHIQKDCDKSLKYNPRLDEYYCESHGSITIEGKCSLCKGLGKYESYCGGMPTGEMQTCEFCEGTGNPFESNPIEELEDIPSRADWLVEFAGWGLDKDVDEGFTLIDEHGDRIRSDQIRELVKQYEEREK